MGTIKYAREVPGKKRALTNGRRGHKESKRTVLLVLAEICQRGKKPRSGNTGRGSGAWCQSLAGGSGAEELNFDHGGGIELDIGLDAAHLGGLIFV